MKFTYDKSELDFIYDTDYCSFGNVDVAGSNYFNDNYSKYVSSLGIKTCTTNRQVSLLYGRGSMGTHTDQVDGYVLLTFLRAEWMEDPKDRPDFHENDGQFFFRGKMFTMTEGDSVIFNDDEEHAWLCNSWWAFVTIPLDCEWVENNVKQKYIGTVLNQEAVDSFKSVH